MNLVGYEKQEITIDGSKANINAFVMMLPISCMVAIPYYIIWHDNLTFQAIKTFAVNYHSGLSVPLIAIVIMVIGIITHELIHGFTWAAYAKHGLKSIRFGILWKEMLPFCHCTEPLTVRHYVVGAVMPAVILGFSPALIAYASGNIWFLLFGIFFTAAAAGDFMIIRLINKEKKNDLVQDHPSKVGCFIYRKITT
jgi:hypothetical protein